MLHLRCYVKTLTGRTICLDASAVQPCSLIMEVKQCIAEVMGEVPPIEQHVTFAGRQLEDGQTVADCNISAGSHIDMAIRILGD